MIQRTENLKGFTIIELIIVIAIGSALILVLFSLFEGQMRNYGYQQAQLEASGSTRAAMDNLMTYTMQASNVLASRTVNSVSYSSDEDTMVLELPTINASYQRLADTYDYVVFNRSGSDLMMIVAPNASSFRRPITRKLADNLETLVITYNNVDFPQIDKVDVSISTRSSYRGDKFIEMQVSDTFFLRNIPRPEDD